MTNEKRVPEYLYRGMCISYEELKDFVFTGIDMELPYEPYIDEQGRKTVSDGNEYGIYMSDNPKMPLNAYANATNKGNGVYVNPPLFMGNRMGYVMIPDVGICYKISTKNLNVRNPWISDTLQGVYNNGWSGDEWITDKIPAENYEIMQVMIGQDMLHDTQYIELNDIEHLQENIMTILEQRKARLEVFAQEMSKIPENKRKYFSLEHFRVFKEIYGENGLRYISDFEEIDTSSDIGMIRYLMAKVYEKDRDNIDFSTLVKLQDLKERVEMAQKKGKIIDIKELIKSEEFITLIEQKEKNTMGSEKEDTIETTDFYERYGITPNDDWDKIQLKLRTELKKWMKRSSTTPNKEVLEEVYAEIDKIGQALEIFNPKNEGMRENYDVMLERSKEKSQIENKEKNTPESEIVAKNGVGIGEHKTVGKSKVSGNILSNIACSIRENPVSLARLKEIQQEISNQAINRDRLKQKHTKKEQKLPDNIDI